MNRHNGLRGGEKRKSRLGCRNGGTISSLGGNNVSLNQTMDPFTTHDETGNAEQRTGALLFFLLNTEG
jgi:hypothetical protein